MVCYNPGCLGNYDFDRIAFFARKRFIEGNDTMTLMRQAQTEREKEEIALVCMLDVEDDQIRDLNLSCKYSDVCKATNCLEKIRNLISEELAA